MIFLPRDALTDIRFHMKILGVINRWDRMQRIAFTGYYCDERSLRRIVYDLDIPKISVRILLLYGLADIGIASLLYCVRYGIPVKRARSDLFFKTLRTEELCLYEKLAEQNKESVFNAIKRQIAEMPETKQGGNENAL